LIPIIIVAVVIGSVIAFAVFSTTITTTAAKIYLHMTEITETTTTPPRGIARIMMIYSLNQTRYEKSFDKRR
jgi:hypothetical protein